MTAGADVAAAKAAIRAEALARRRTLDPDTARVLSLSILERLMRLDVYRSARVVHTYIGAVEGEVQTRELVSRALRSGKRVLVPRAEREPRRLEHYEIASLEDLEPSGFGLWEPSPERARRVDAAAADLVVVPGVAFDRQGWRLGFGAGYYDRFLAGVHAPKVAPAYSFQLREALPHKPHDVPVDLVVTEVETVDCRAHRGDGREGGAAR